MRKYQAIWEQLKLPPHRAELAAPKNAHPRIIQAVRKERSNDLGWKYQLEEEGKRYRMKDTSNGGLLKLELLRDDPLSIGDL